MDQVDILWNIRAGTKSNKTSQEKSCVNVSGKKNIYLVLLKFDNLSPLIFSLCLERSCKRLEKIQEMDQLVQDSTLDLVSYLKLYILVYADDTVLLAESPEDLHNIWVLWMNIVSILI